MSKKTAQQYGKSNEKQPKNAVNLVGAINTLIPLPRGHPKSPFAGVVGRAVFSLRHTGITLQCGGALAFVEDQT